ncbi:MAG: hypothetical protein ACJ72M_03745, partial [Propionibacteriaceae bacterium]
MTLRASSVRVETTVQRLGDRAVGDLAAVLVDQGGRGGVVAHPGHQVAQARAGLGGERVAGVPEVVQV